MTPDFWAFISYSHADERQAKWLHGWLEAYRVPKKLIAAASEQQAVECPARLRPVYRDAEEFSAGQRLGDHIEAALRGSRNLIVLCSPKAVASRWVNDEIRYFQSLGRGDRIFCLVVDGDPNALNGPTQCMPSALLSSAGKAGADVLAADIRPGRDKPRVAALRLAAGALGLRFDDLRQREQERRVRQLSIATGVAVTLLAAMGLLTFFALQQRDEATQQRAEAVHQTQVANEQRSVADQRRRDAEQATARAQEATARAITSDDLAQQKRQEAEASAELASVVSHS